MTMQGLTPQTRDPLYSLGREILELPPLSAVTLRQAISIFSGFSNIMLATTTIANDEDVKMAMTSRLWEKTASFYKEDFQNLVGKNLTDSVAMLKIREMYVENKFVFRNFLSFSF